MFCTPVFIFTSGSSVLLGRPRCGLSIWLSLFAIFNTLFLVYVNLFHKKMDKTRKHSKSAIFVWYENGRRRLLDEQSINTESFLCGYVGGSSARDCRFRTTRKSVEFWVELEFVRKIDLSKLVKWGSKSHVLWFSAHLPCFQNDRCVICVSRSVHVISAYYVREGS